MLRKTILNLVIVIWKLKKKINKDHMYSWQPIIDNYFPPKIPFTGRSGLQVNVNSV